MLELLGSLREARMAAVRLLRRSLLLGVCALLVPAAGASAQNRVALVGGMLLDGYEADPIHHAAILIEGNRIVAVGPRDEVLIPPGTRIIDTRGKTMMPGLIDLHVHLMILGHGEYQDWFPVFLERKEEVMEISARQLLMAGVTTAVDLGAPLEITGIRDRIKAGDIPGPRLLVSGPWITRATGGWPLFFQYPISSPAEAAERARHLVANGVDLIKVWAGMDRADMEAVMGVARDAGIQVHAHVYSPQAIRDALDARVHVLQHVGSGGNTPYDDALVLEIAHRSVPVVQTLSHRIWVYPATVAFPERLEDPRLKDDLPPDLYEMVQKSFKDFHRLSYFRTTQRQIRNSTLAARQFIEADAVSAMGTDSGSPMNFHTESAGWELRSLVDSGMSPIQAISASTMVGARVLGLGNDLGTIEPGKLADVIVVDGNPLENIDVVRRVVHVIKDGIVYR
jgi:imidazolonepropionase-like amidohydrolase